MKPILLLLSLSLLICLGSAYAQDLGVHGNVYDIQEEDAVAYIKRRLTEFERSGEIKRRQELARNKVKDSLLNPKPVPGITTAVENRVYFYDPTFVQATTVTDAKGRIIVPAGTSINPLQYRSLTHKYIFIDGRDTKQVEFAAKLATPADKIVLTGGSWLEMSKKIDRQAYYDQNGALTRKFNIQSVPAVLSQHGMKLRIEIKVL